MGTKVCTGSCIYCQKIIVSVEKGNSPAYHHLLGKYLSKTNYVSVNIPVVGNTLVCLGNIIRAVWLTAVKKWENRIVGNKI